MRRGAFFLGPRPPPFFAPGREEARAPARRRRPVPDSPSLRARCRRAVATPLDPTAAARPRKAIRRTSPRRRLFPADGGACVRCPAVVDRREEGVDVAGSAGRGREDGRRPVDPAAGMEGAGRRAVPVAAHVLHDHLLGRHVVLVDRAAVLDRLRGHHAALQGIGDRVGRLGALRRQLHHRVEVAAGALLGALLVAQRLERPVRPAHLHRSDLGTPGAAKRQPRSDRRSCQPLLRTWTRTSYASSCATRLGPPGAESAQVSASAAQVPRE